VGVCSDALQLNAKLVSAEQQDYQAMLSETFHKMCAELAALLSPSDATPPIRRRNSCAFFSAISGLQGE
jgi:Dock homology region 2